MVTARGLTSAPNRWDDVSSEQWMPSRRWKVTHDSFQCELRKTIANQIRNTYFIPERRKKSEFFSSNCTVDVCECKATPIIRCKVWINLISENSNRNHSKFNSKQFFCALEAKLKIKKQNPLRRVRVLSCREQKKTNWFVVANMKSNLILTILKYIVVVLFLAAFGVMSFMARILFV